jgi:predicted acylesterase/phospholipase RssA
MRLNKELSPEQRQSLFRPLVSSWLDLSLSPDPHSPDVVPDSGLKVPHVEKTGNKDAIHFHDYNRALAAGAAVDHLLDGAGIEERKEMLAFIKQEMRKRDGQAQEFVDRNTQLAGRLKPPTLNELLDEKKRPLAEVGSPGYNALQTWISRNSERYFDPAETLGPELTGVSEFYNPNKKTPKSVTRVMDLLQSQPTGDQPLTETFGQGEKTSKASMVFAGGGGKGLVYTHQLKHLSAQLSASKDGKFEIDEFVGTSAGAITAGLLAAGFSPKELDVVMKEIDFSSFYSDYFGKQGGIDPTARGLNRSGIFSMRSMYETLSGLLSSKLGVEGRPVTFADLKPDLKIVTRLTTTDLPEGSELTEQTGPDGKFVFSKENTPHMDVAAALIASSAIPAFFDPPQMMVSGADGEPRRMQFTDGGILDNFAVSETSKAEKSVLAIIPNPSAGVLTTDFMPPAEELEKAFAMGDQLMQGKIASSLVPSYHRLRDNLDMGRIVFGNYLVGNLDEAADITFQGQSRSDTRAIYEHIAAPSHVAGAGLFPTETLVEDMMNKILTGKPDLVAGIAGRMGGRGVKESEVDGPEEVILSTLRGALSSPKEAFQTA